MPTQEDLKKFASAIIRNEKFGNTMCYLYDRWRDESAYEDINEYGKALHNVANEIVPCEYVKSTKRPFGVVVNYKGVKVHLYAKLNGCYLTFNAKVVTK